MVNWTERLFVDRLGALRVPCKSCGRDMFIPPSQRGQRATCSAECASARARALPWHKRLNEPRDSAVEKACVVCASAFWLPPSKAGLWHTCSSACASAKRDREALARQRLCETCGSTFSPRPNLLAIGQGRFCSQACNTTARAALLKPEIKAKAVARKRELLASGAISYPKGPANKQWEGGPRAAVLRRRADGREAAGLRAYRAANPDKVREFSQRRAGRKFDRLPRGTLPKIREMQKDRCAICRKAVKGAGHFDHIVPLARGGRHEGRNIQLLCAPCNLSKNARDPIDHMQSLGRLL